MNKKADREREERRDLEREISMPQDANRRLEEQVEFLEEHPTEDDVKCAMRETMIRVLGNIARLNGMVMLGGCSLATVKDLEALVRAYQKFTDLAEDERAEDDGDD